MKNIGIFYLKICFFFEVKFSIYLNKHVFVMNNNNNPLIPLAHYINKSMKYIISCSFGRCIKTGVGYY